MSGLLVQKPDGSIDEQIEPDDLAAPFRAVPGMRPPDVLRVNSDGGVRVSVTRPTVPGKTVCAAMTATRFRRWPNHA